MALTVREKRELDAKVLRFIESIGTDEFTNAMVKAYINDSDISASSIRSSVQRVVTTEMGNCAVRAYGEKPVKYRISEMLTSILSRRVKKERNLLYFDTPEEKPLYFDFITKQFSIPNILDNMDCVFGWYKDMLENFVRYDLGDLEWIFNYTENIGNVISIVRCFNKSEIATMPQGLAEYLNTENVELDTHTLRNYLMLKKYGNFGVNVYNTMGERFMNNFMNCDAKVITKIVQTTIKNGIWSFECSLRDLVELCHNSDEMKNLLDTNRDIEYNLKTLQNYRDREKKRLLAEQLQKLNFINGVEIENYVIVVPQNQNEKVAEGKMQNNCVGSFYDNSIISGENLIYFIRKKSNPTKSYITCRYNLSSEDTVEFRYKNNYSVNDRKDIEVVKAISNLIRNGLA